MSYALYRCTHPPCPVLVKEAAIGITPLAYCPVLYENMRLKAEGLGMAGGYSQLRR
jgi:hypothetical protein